MNVLPLSTNQGESIPIFALPRGTFVPISDFNPP